MSANPERPPTASEHEGHQERYSDGLRWWPRHSEVRDFSEIFLYDGSIVAQLDFLHHPPSPARQLAGIFFAVRPLKKRNSAYATEFPWYNQKKECWMFDSILDLGAWRLHRTIQ